MFEEYSYKIISEDELDRSSVDSEPYFEAIGKGGFSFIVGLDGDKLGIFVMEARSTRPTVFMLQAIEETKMVKPGEVQMSKLPMHLEEYSVIQSILGDRLYHFERY